MIADMLLSIAKCATLSNLIDIKLFVTDPRPRRSELDRYESYDCAADASCLPIGSYTMTYSRGLTYFLSRVNMSCSSFSHACRNCWLLIRSLFAAGLNPVDCSRATVGLLACASLAAAADVGGGITPAMASCAAETSDVQELLQCVHYGRPDWADVIASAAITASRTQRHQRRQGRSGRLMSAMGTTLGSAPPDTGAYTYNVLFVLRFLCLMFVVESPTVGAISARGGRGGEKLEPTGQPHLLE